MASVSILVVDDDIDEIIMLYEAFQVRKDQIDVAFLHNPEGVIPYLDALRDEFLPDVIISDLNMPKLNGIELLKQLKSSSRYRQIPVFISSTSTSDREKGLGLLAGAREVISKPRTSLEYSALAELMIKDFGRKS